MSTQAPSRRNDLSATAILAMATVYFVWGSTYLAIRFALQGFPPLFFPGLRFSIAGTILYTVLRLRGRPAPSARQWAGTALIGLLMLCLGNGGVVLAQQSVGSGLAATAVATVPLWASLIAGLWGEWPGRFQWIGLALGFGGIVLLNLGGDFAANPVSAGLLMFASVSWAFGTVYSRRLSLPGGLMNSACQMLCAGLLFFIGSAARGESWRLDVSPQALLALAYLTVFGSLVAYSAYVYLMQNVAPALTTSYAYVNPVIAVLLGVSFAGEVILPNEWIAIGCVLSGVVMIVLGRRRSA